MVRGDVWNLMIVDFDHEFRVEEACVGSVTIRQTSSDQNGLPPAGQLHPVHYFHPDPNPNRTPDLILRKLNIPSNIMKGTVVGQPLKY